LLSPLLGASVTRYVVVGTAGHIDHGKSALVHALTGTDPDRLKEEKLRGITIDLGFAHLDEGETTLAFVDVPGHERFVKNMLAGASGIDGVLLVVAADESVMPQTREHFAICRLLGVTTGVVALTKADLVDADTVELVQLETAELVAGSFLEGAAVVPVSARTGEGIAEVRSALLTMASRAHTRSQRGAIRLPVDRAFSVKGFGTVVTGTLVSGRVAVDATLTVLPSGRDVKVRGLQVHGAAQSLAVAGQRVAANLSGVDVSQIARGDTVVTPGCFEATRRVDAVLDLLGSAHRLRHGARVRFHQGTSEVLGRVVLGPGLGETGGVVDAPGELAPGDRGFVRLRLERHAVLTRGDRFILRAYSPPLTIAGGQVLDPQPPRGGLRTAAARRRLERLLDGVVGEVQVVRDLACGELVRERGIAGLPVAAFVTRAGVAPELVEDLTARLVASAAVRRVGDLIVDAAAFAEVGDRLLDMVTTFHASHPLSEGLPREEARERLFRHGSPAVFEAVLDQLVGDDRLRARDHLALTSHHVTLSPEETRASEGVQALLGDAGLRPPAPAALREQLGYETAVLDRVLKLLVRQKRVVRVGALVFDSGALDTLRQDVLSLKTSPGAGTIDVSTFKTRYGISRKFAIPLLEYLDRERVTRRIGQQRIVL
jgi:selenocysteine-specific elongation factor